jgi:hypothetical protein
MARPNLKCSTRNAGIVDAADRSVAFLADPVRPFGRIRHVGTVRLPPDGVFTADSGWAWKAERTTAMASLTEPLRKEHRVLLPHIEQPRLAADLVGGAANEETRRAADEAYRFLVGHLIPHAQGEDAALYPVVARLMGAPEATAIMRRDHAEVGTLTGELGALRARLVAGVGDGGGGQRGRSQCGSRARPAPKLPCGWETLCSLPYAAQARFVTMGPGRWCS